MPRPVSATVTRARAAVALTARVTAAAGRHRVERVGQQVVQDLLQVPVAGLARTGSGQTIGDVDAPFLGGRPPGRGPVADHRVHRDRAGATMPFSALATVSSPLTSRDSRPISSWAPASSAAVASSAVLPEQVEPQPQRGQRRPHLVRDVGHHRAVAVHQGLQGGPPSC